jgi:hypothetical protein
VGQWFPKFIWEDWSVPGRPIVPAIFTERGMAAQTLSGMKCQLEVNTSGVCLGEPFAYFLAIEKVRNTAKPVLWTSLFQEGRLFTASLPNKFGDYGG